MLGSAILIMLGDFDRAEGQVSVLRDLFAILLVCGYRVKNSINKKVHHALNFNGIQVLAYTDDYA